MLKTEQIDVMAEFLEDGVNKMSTRKIYANGLRAFEAYYQPQGTIADFLARQKADLDLPRAQQQRVATKNLRAFIKYLQEQEYSKKTVNTYTNALRAFVSFHNDYEYSIPIKHSGLPSSEAESEKQNWDLQTISDFNQTFNDPLYEAILAVIISSGLGIEDVLALPHSEEIEKGNAPILLHLTRHKTGIPFITFLNQTAVDQIKAHYKEAGTPKLGEPIFKVTKGSVERFFARRARKLLMKKLGKQPKTVKLWENFNPMRPHTLRGAFEMLLILAGCPEIIAEYWMGHETDKQKGAYILKGMSEKQHLEQYLKFVHALNYKISKD